MPQHKTWTAGEVLTAANLNDYLMNQAVIVCASSADRPSSPIEGMLIYESDVNRFMYYTGSSWKAWMFDPSSPMDFSPHAGTPVDVRDPGSDTLGTSYTNLAIDRFPTSGNLSDARLVLVTGSTYLQYLPTGPGAVDGYIRLNYEINSSGSQVTMAEHGFSTNSKSITNETAVHTVCGIHLLGSGDHVEYRIAAKTDSTSMARCENASITVASCRFTMVNNT